MNPTSKLTAKRGDILRVTAGPHAGGAYRFVRTMSGRDRDLCGDEVGPTRYTYNLFNVNTGKARVTENSRQFRSTFDGVNSPIPLTALENFFGLGLRNVTDEPTIAPVVNKAIDAQQVKQDVAAAMQRIVPSARKLLPVFDGRGVVMGYAMAA